MRTGLIALTGLGLAAGAGCTSTSLDTVQAGDPAFAQRVRQNDLALLWLKVSTEPYEVSMWDVRISDTEICGSVSNAGKSCFPLADIEYAKVGKNELDVGLTAVAVPAMALCYTIFPVCIADDR